MIPLPQQPLDAGAFIQTVLSISAAYLAKNEAWSNRFMPFHFEGLSDAAVEQLKQPFDFIIVGSGYAGSLIASRLAAGGCHRVLLLEAGSPPRFDSVIPFLDNVQFVNDTWNIMTTPQRYAARAMKEQKVRLLNGKSLGGSSVTDHGIYYPVNPEDFDRWSSQYGLHDWSADNMEPYIFKIQDDPQPQDFEADYDELIENITQMIEKKDPLVTTNPLSFLWAHAGNSMGYPIMSGIDNRVHDKGAFFVPTFMSESGVRMIPTSQFLKPVEKGGLVIVTGVEVNKLIFSDKTAFGVEFTDIRSNLTQEATSRREIILSAGTIGSAKILMQSGVGPGDHLHEQKIPIVRNLPVGQSLRDRLELRMFITMRKIFMDSMKMKLMDLNEVLNYFENGTGVYARGNVVGSALLKTNDADAASLRLTVRHLGYMGLDTLKSVMNLREDMAKVMQTAVEDGGLEVTMTVLQPLSVGSMWLERLLDNDTETDYFYPVINPNYLGDDRDALLMIKGAQFVEALTQTNYMRLIDAKVIKPEFRACQNTNTSTDSWRCVIAHLATTGRRLSGSNKMGRVVDTNLKVKGLERLRIVDESVFPEPVSGGFAASVLAVANKASQLILEDNGGARTCRRKT